MIRGLENQLLFRRFVLSSPMSRRVVTLLAVHAALLGRADSADAAWARQQERLVAVCSTTQVADFVRQVVGDRWEVVCVLAPGQDPHTYQTTTDDARQVARATLCFENGWHLEGADWMRKLAENAGKPIVTCVDGLEPLVIEEEGRTTNDPHAWFSPANAAHYVRTIRDAVVGIDPGHASEYRARADAYVLQLGALHQWALRELADIAPDQRILITNHDAFGYFCRDYGFRAVTPVGWSTKDEIGGGASIDRHDEVVRTVRSAGVRSIFVETSINPRMMQQLAEETGVVVGGTLYSDSMGAADSAGESYVGMMRENVLRIVSGLAIEPTAPRRASVDAPER